jgi:hypothetical protein
VSLAACLATLAVTHAFLRRVEGLRLIARGAEHGGWSLYEVASADPGG